ncbi:hypothetical protein J4437_01970 [Candidatus Woesearchaeota archaeon]|nr:hypothetical protein [Candidatus Woesearchaeota archaeon]
MMLKKRLVVFFLVLVLLTFICLSNLVIANEISSATSSTKPNFGLINYNLALQLSQENLIGKEIPSQLDFLFGQEAVILHFQDETLSEKEFVVSIITEDKMIKAIMAAETENPTLIVSLETQTAIDILGSPTPLKAFLKAKKEDKVTIKGQGLNKKIKFSLVSMLLGFAQKKEFSSENTGRSEKTTFSSSSSSSSYSTEERRLTGSTRPVRSSGTSESSRTQERLPDRPVTRKLYRPNTRSLPVRPSTASENISETASRILNAIEEQALDNRANLFEQETYTYDDLVNYTMERETAEATSPTPTSETADRILEAINDGTEESDDTLSGTISDILRAIQDQPPITTTESTESAGDVPNILPSNSGSTSIPGLAGTYSPEPLPGVATPTVPVGSAGSEPTATEPTATETINCDEISEEEIPRLNPNSNAIKIFNSPNGKRILRIINDLQPDTRGRDGIINFNQVIGLRLSSSWLEVNNIGNVEFDFLESHTNICPPALSGETYLDHDSLVDVWMNLKMIEPRSSLGLVDPESLDYFPPENSAGYYDFEVAEEEYYLNVQIGRWEDVFHEAIGGGYYTCYEKHTESKISCDLSEGPIPFWQSLVGGYGPDATVLPIVHEAGTTIAIKLSGFIPYTGIYACTGFC